jgi:hypothetical protein
VLAGAPDAGTGQKSTVLAKRHGAADGIMTKRDGFLGEVLHHAETNGVVKLVHVGGVIGGLARRTAFQNDGGQGSARAKLFGHQQAGPPTTNNHGINSG